MIEIRKILWVSSTCSISVSVILVCSSVSTILVYVMHHIIFFTGIITCYIIFLHYMMLYTTYIILYHTYTRIQVITT